MRRQPQQLTDDAIEQMLQARSRRPDPPVLDNILAGTLNTPQRPTRWLGSLEAMRSHIPHVATGLAVIALLGGALAVGLALQRLSQVAEPPVVRRVPSEFDTTALQGGLYYIDSPIFTAVPFSFTLPSGWVSENYGHTLSKFGTPLGEVGLAMFVLDDVYADACTSDEREIPIGPTVHDLMSALLSQVGPRTSGPFDITVGGHPGKRIDLAAPADFKRGACRFSGGLQIWRDRMDYFQVVLPDSRVSIYAVDVDGKRLVVATSYRASTSTTHIAELRAIIDSIRFTW
jgi:hypothetical protein